MRIDTLHLVNFRCFESLKLDLNPDLTIFLGENASGKTALLDALAIGAGDFLRGFGLEDAPRVRPRDARRTIYQHGAQVDVQRHSTVWLRFEDNSRGGRLAWHRDLVGDEGVSVITQSLGLGGEVVRHEVSQGKNIDLPLLAYYGTRRLLGAVERREERYTPSRNDGYLGCMASSTDVGAMERWIRQATYAELQEGAPDPVLRALSGAVASCIEGCEGLVFDIRQDELRLEMRGGERAYFSELSDGFRNVMALIADLAWRALVLNPHLGDHAIQEARGVVLIDELDLHLHPRWQRRIVGDLRRLFPKVQFVVTTHSPQVVASVPQGAVRILRREPGASSPTVQEPPPTWGRDTNALLEQVFGVDERPSEVKARLSAIFAAIDQGALEEAEARLQALEQTLTPDDGELTQARWLLQMERAAPSALDVEDEDVADPEAT